MKSSGLPGNRVLPGNTPQLSDADINVKDSNCVSSVESRAAAEIGGPRKTRLFSQLQALKAQVKGSENSRTKALRVIPAWNLLSETAPPAAVTLNRESHTAGPAKTHPAKQDREGGWGRTYSMGNEEEIGNIYT